MNNINLPLARKTSLAVSLLLVLGLSGCSSDLSDLSTFVLDAKTKQKPKVQPLPEIKPHETFRYSAGHLKDPFQAAVAKKSATVKSSGKGKGPKPLEGRAREALEAFPLDALRMVGTLEQQKVRWSLVSTNDGTIHRVKAGNYIGLNHGKIINITEDKLELMEIVPDGLGDWIERPASLKLAGAKK